MGVDVTGNTLTTTFTQLPPKCTARLVEEEAKKLTLSSSFEISLSAQQ
jgi:hypothetical protein